MNRRISTFELRQGRGRTEVGQRSERDKKETGQFLFVFQSFAMAFACVSGCHEVGWRELGWREFGLVSCLELPWLVFDLCWIDR